MKSGNHGHHRPDLMLLLVFFVLAGVLLTSVADAAEPDYLQTDAERRAAQSDRDGFFSLWDFNLAEKLRSWVPARRDDGSGLSLSKPFGANGPSLRITNGIPDEVAFTLRDGGDDRVGALDSDQPDAFLFLYKRW